MKKISKNEVEKIFQSDFDKEIFDKEIFKLKAGEALQIPQSEWIRKTPPHVHFSQHKATKGMVKVKYRDRNIYVIKIKP